MRFQASTSELAAAAGYVDKVVASRPTQPVMAGVIIHAGQEGVSLSGTDPNAGWTHHSRVAAAVAQEGAVVVLSRLFAEVTAAATTDRIEVSLEGSQVRVTAGRAKFVLPAMAVEDFPTLAWPTVAAAGTIPADVLLAAVEGVHPAVATDTSMPMLQCIALELSAKEVTLAATDRYRMAATSLVWKASGLQPLSVLAPGKGLLDAVKGLAKDGGDVALAVEANGQLVLSGPNRCAVLSPMEGEFPQWRALLPKAPTGCVTLDAKEAVNAIARVSIVATKGDSVELELTADQVRLRCGAEEASAGADEIAAEYDGTPMVVRFNPQFLRDGIAACGSGRVHLDVTSENKPVLVRPEQGSYQYLVVPIRSR